MLSPDYGLSVLVLVMGRLDGDFGSQQVRIAIFDLPRCVLVFVKKSQVVRRRAALLLVPQLTVPLEGEV